MPDTGFVTAGTGTDNASEGTDAWPDPERITADDATYAGMLMSGSSVSHFLRASNFGFALPAGATIDGVQVRTQRHKGVGAATMSDSTVKLFDASGVPAGDDKSTGAAWSETVETVATFGGPADLWGLTPTKADIEDTDWGWGQSCVTGGFMTTAVDVMQMKVYYTLAEGPAQTLMGMECL